MKVSAITFVSAVALHAVAAVGLSTLGRPHGTGTRIEVGGATIDIEQPASETASVHEEEPVAETKSAAARSSYGAPNPVHVLARESSASPASTGDAVPNPEPTQSAPPTHFKMAMAAQVGTQAGEVAAPTAVVPTNEVVADAEVTERARKVGGVAPVYPADAAAQGVELGAPLPFEIVVDTNGRVIDAHSLKHAGYGFDEAAVAALRTYRFSPATRNGHAVNVRMKWNVEFRFK